LCSAGENGKTEGRAEGITEKRGGEKISALFDPSHWDVVQSAGNIKAGLLFRNLHCVNRFARHASESPTSISSSP